MRLLAAIWGVSGVILLLGAAVYRLFDYAIETFDQTLMWYHWLMIVLWTAFMLYSEGYKGFQKAFSPRVAARAKYLAKHASILQGILAPLFCMTFFHSTKKRLIVSWILTTFIVVFIILIKFLDQPYRGIVDIGVVLGLSYGIITIIV